jgi:hypothetical protein
MLQSALAALCEGIRSTIVHDRQTILLRGSIPPRFDADATYCFAHSWLFLLIHQLMRCQKSAHNNISNESSVFVSAESRKEDEKRFSSSKLIFYDIISANEASLIVSFRRNFC